MSLLNLRLEHRSALLMMALVTSSGCSPDKQDGAPSTTEPDGPGENSSDVGGSEPTDSGATASMPTGAASSTSPTSTSVSPSATGPEPTSTSTTDGTSTSPDTGIVPPPVITLDREHNIFPLGDAPIPRHALHSYVDFNILATGTIVQVTAGLVAPENNGFLSDACVLEQTDECVYTQCTIEDRPQVPIMYVDAGDMTLSSARLGEGNDMGVIRGLDFRYVGTALLTFEIGDVIHIDFSGGEYPAFSVDVTVPSALVINQPQLEYGKATLAWPDALSLQWDGGLEGLFLDVVSEPGVKCTYAAERGMGVVPQTMIEKMDQALPVTPYVVQRQVVTTEAGDVVVSIRRNLYHVPNIAYAVKFNFE
jgi:hypothetical protein